ncbi:hypothetical protein I317_06431 [Kwoniella heveanensis CBS 569]|nr:hypothetical protein I317_06431 [Kwoniella heveanensis CBS 569]
MPRENGVRIHWGGQNVHENVRMLELIKSKDLYLRTFFPVGMIPARDRWIGERAFCLEFFKDHAWMIEMESKGMVVKVDGAWVSTEKWTNSIGNPIARKCKALIERMSRGHYKSRHGIQLGWSSWDDIPKQIDKDLTKRYRKFQAQHPYYFLLRELWLRTQTPARRTDVLLGDQQPTPIDPLTPIQKRQVPSDSPTSDSKRVKCGEDSPGTVGSAIAKVATKDTPSRLGWCIDEPILISDEDEYKEQDQNAHHSITRLSPDSPGSLSSRAASQVSVQRDHTKSTGCLTETAINAENGADGSMGDKVEEKETEEDEEKGKKGGRIEVETEPHQDVLGLLPIDDELENSQDSLQEFAEKREAIDKTDIGRSRTEMQVARAKQYGEREEVDGKSEVTVEGASRLEGAEKGAEEDVEEYKKASPDGIEQARDEKSENEESTNSWKDSRPKLSRVALTSIEPSDVWKYFEGKEIPLRLFTPEVTEGLREEPELHDWVQARGRFEAGVEATSRMIRQAQCSRTYFKSHNVVVPAYIFEDEVGKLALDLMKEIGVCLITNTDEMPKNRKHYYVLYGAEWLSFTKEKSRVCMIRTLSSYIEAMYHHFRVKLRSEGEASSETEEDEGTEAEVGQTSASHCLRKRAERLCWELGTTQSLDELLYGTARLRPMKPGRKVCVTISISIATSIADALRAICENESFVLVNGPRDHSRPKSVVEHIYIGFEAADNPFISHSDSDVGIPSTMMSPRQFNEYVRRLREENWASYKATTMAKRRVGGWG